MYGSYIIIWKHLMTKWLSWNNIGTTNDSWTTRSYNIDLYMLFPHEWNYFIMKKMVIDDFNTPLHYILHIKIAGKKMDYEK